MQETVTNIKKTPIININKTSSFSHKHIFVLNKLNSIEELKGQTHTTTVIVEDTFNALSQYLTLSELH